MSNDTTVGGGEASRQKLEQLASQGLAWLADAPLFIDRAQVTAFYDAIVRPESAWDAEIPTCAVSCRFAPLTALVL
jgi:hypothetical protein